jgi:hypothetical protein
LLFFGPLGQAEPRVQTKSRLEEAQFWLLVFLAPLLKPKRGVRAKGKHEVAGHGPPRSPQAQGCALGEPSEPSAERGNPRGLRVQSPGCPFFRFLSLGTQRKEPVVRGRNPGSK